VDSNIIKPHWLRQSWGLSPDIRAAVFAVVQKHLLGAISFLSPMQNALTGFSNQGFQFPSLTNTKGLAAIPPLLVQMLVTLNTQTYMQCFCSTFGVFGQSHGLVPPEGHLRPY